jgi:hypothetical protein
VPAILLPIRGVDGILEKSDWAAPGDGGGAGPRPASANASPFPASYGTSEAPGLTLEVEGSAMPSD